MENNIYESPNSDVTNPEPGSSHLASRWSRLGASIIDGLIMMPIVLTIMYFTGGFDPVTQGVQPSFLYSFVMGLVNIFLFVVIHGYLLVHYGQTVGKKMLNIKIVTMGQKLPSRVDLLQRYGVFWLVPMIPLFGPLFAIIDLLFIFSKSKRCLHDFVGGTQVVKIEGA